MNLLAKSLNFITLKRKGLSTRSAAYAFHGRLTDGDKYALTMLVLVLAIVAVVMNVPAIDCVPS